MRVYLVASLLTLLPAAAEVTVDLPQTTLGAALQAVAQQAGLTLELPADLPREQLLRVDLTAVPPLVALRAVTAGLDGARWELRQTTAVLHWTPPPAPPVAPAASPAKPPAEPPVGPTGRPGVGSGQWVRIPVYYHDAAALATVLGGRPLRYADLDPWYAALLGAAPSPAAAGRLPLPAGVSDLVGADWLRGLLAR
ncbi:MAG: hypothetical protein IT204_16580 [Fimbriimonadaceae bacterium]|nr:hypothetical protein [Fimbriimonadaceae bacterium]